MEQLPWHLLLERRTSSSMWKFNSHIQVFIKMVIHFDKKIRHIHKNINLYKNEYK